MSMIETRKVDSRSFEELVWHPVDPETDDGPQMAVLNVERSARHIPSRQDRRRDNNAEDAVPEREEGCGAVGDDWRGSAHRARPTSSPDREGVCDRGRAPLGQAVPECAEKHLTEDEPGGADCPPSFLDPGSAESPGSSDWLVGSD